MKVGQMIKLLKKFNADLELTITDGFDCKCYEGDFEIVEIDGVIDIGVGGMNKESEKENQDGL